MLRRCLSFFFFFNDTATTEIYTLSLHDALPICPCFGQFLLLLLLNLLFLYRVAQPGGLGLAGEVFLRSEEHTSELQSLAYLVCRLLLEKKKRLRRCSYIQRLISTGTAPLLRLLD